MLLEAAGTDRVVALEVHNTVAFQNAFRSETVALDTRPIFLDRAVSLAGTEPIVVASPDPGGVKRAQLFREALEHRLVRPVDSVRTIQRIGRRLSTISVSRRHFYLAEELLDRAVHIRPKQPSSAELRTR